MPTARGKKKAVETPVEGVEVTAETTSKKVSKKPVKVVAVVTPNGIEGSFSTEPRRPLIAHLQIKTNEVVFHDQVLRYDPNPPSAVDPEPYDAAATDMFTAGQEIIPGLRETAKEKTDSVDSEEAISAPVVEEQPVHAMPCFTKHNLMVQFKDASEQKRLPDSTEIACFWCAHTFDGTPCVIPEREVGGVYTVYGNFCCPECAVAYLLTEGIDPHTRWERMALLHRVYDPQGHGRIFPAPARESLKLFGGPLSIDSYRITMREKRVRIDLHLPPMVSILGSIDTKPIDFFDTTIKGGAVASLPTRSMEEGLRLKRSKPLKEKESTLDSVMNIKISAGRRGTGLAALGGAGDT